MSDGSDTTHCEHHPLEKGERRPPECTSSAEGVLPPAEKMFTPIETRWGACRVDFVSARSGDREREAKPAQPAHGHGDHARLFGVEMLRAFSSAAITRRGWDTQFLQQRTQLLGTRRRP